MVYTERSKLGANLRNNSPNSYLSYSPHFVYYLLFSLNAMSKIGQDIPTKTEESKTCALKVRALLNNMPNLPITEVNVAEITLLSRAILGNN